MLKSTHIKFTLKCQYSYFIYISLLHVSLKKKSKQPRNIKSLLSVQNIHNTTVVQQFGSQLHTVAACTTVNISKSHGRAVAVGAYGKCSLQ
uniref:Uncharacterized protein n=1 Tax=Anguilla anguilla TaxID=7936 RepID=A0A0E9WT89_ANGAN